MPPLPEAVMVVLAPLAPRFSRPGPAARPTFAPGGILVPGACTLTATLRATERHFTNYHRVFNRATWSARRGSQRLLGLLLSLLVPPEVPIIGS
jgi:hypothetical protein